MKPVLLALYSCLVSVIIFLDFSQLRLYVLFYLSCLEWLKINIFMVNSRKIILLQIHVSWVSCNVLCMLNLIYYLCSLFKWCFLIFILTLGSWYISVVCYNRICYIHVPLHSVSFMFHTWHVIFISLHHTNAYASLHAL